MKLFLAATTILSALPAISAKGCGLAIGTDKDDGPEGAFGNGGGGRKGKKVKRKNVKAELAPECDLASSVEIELPDGMGIKKFDHKLSGSKNGPKGRVSWYGESDSATFNYIKDDKGAIFGSMVDMKTGDVYQFSPDANGEPTVSITPTSEFPDEADPVEDEMEEPDSEDEIRTRRLEAEAKIAARRPRSLRNIAPRELVDDLGGNLDVLVVWTKHAECKNAGVNRGCTLTANTEALMRARIDLAVEETNVAYDLSGIDTQLRLVHAYLDDTYTEVAGDAFSSGLSALRSQTDGNMDNVHALRTQYGADIVALIIDDPQYCGMAYGGPRIDLMFSVTAWNCATGYYSFGHEIGHNMGCNHDKGTKNACSNSAYNYGFRDPGAQFRSILAYNCNSGQCDNNAGGGCPRVQRFSNDEFQYQGKPIGSAQHDNARRINDVKATIAAYYPAQSTCSSNSDCDDGVFCNGSETCSGGMCTAGGNPCSGVEVCNESTDTCDNPSCSDVTVAVKTDYYPGETSWRIKDSSGTVVMSGDGYSQYLTTYTETDCLNSGSYTFTIDDTWGDGICCSYGQGDYSVKKGSSTLASGGSFGSSETKTIVV